MRRLLLGLFLTAAGCGTPGPRDEAVLLTDVQERADRDVLAFYYSEAENGTLLSIVVPRSGDADLRFEIGTKGEFGSITGALVQSGTIPRRDRRTVPFSPEQRSALEARFSALPRGASEWTLPFPPPPRQPHEKEFGPVIERSRVPRTFRMILVTKTGEVKSAVIVHQGGPKAAPASAKPGGEALSALEKAFKAPFLPPSARD